MLEKFAAQSLVEYDGELIFSKEKFAELIVRECADIAKRNSGEPDPYSENYDAQVAAERKAQEIYDEIMSDFGVEQ
jgi:hypothetical protein